MSDALFTAAVGGRLQQLRTKAGLSPERVAKKAGLRVALLRDIEEGRARPSVAVLDQVARQLGVSLAKVVGEVARKPAKDVSPQELKRSLERIGQETVSLPEDVGDKLEAIEAAVVRHAMIVCAGNKSAAARLLGLERKALMRRWDKLQRAAKRAAKRH